MSIEGVYPLLLLLASVLPQAPQTASVFLSQDFQTAQAPTTTATPVPKDQTMLLPQHDPAGFQLRAGLWETTIVFTLGDPSPKTSQKSQTCQSKSDWVQLVVSEANFSSGVDTCTLTGQTLQARSLRLAPPAYSRTVNYSWDPRTARQSAPTNHQRATIKQHQR